MQIIIILLLFQSFQCPACDRSYAGKDYVRRHMLRKHGIGRGGESRGGGGGAGRGGGGGGRMHDPPPTMVTVMDLDVGVTSVVE